jgi:hypothetical protein
MRLFALKQIRRGVILSKEQYPSLQTACEVLQRTNKTLILRFVDK